MLHLMNLHDSPFAMINSGYKTIEMRLYDEKRQMISVGDIIEFTNNKTQEKIYCLVINLHIYPSFKELYEKFDPRLLGYLDGEAVSYHDMEMYYPEEKINKYGVIGIEIKKISIQELHYTSGKDLEC